MNKTKYERKYVKHYNYTQGIRCNDIKPIERKFFRYLIRQINYKELDPKSNIVSLSQPVREYVNKFATKYNVPYKQLLYYLEKWSNRGIYDYGVSLDLGWFENIYELVGICTPEYRSDRDRIKVYRDMIPQRVRSKVISEYTKYMNK